MTVYGYARVSTAGQSLNEQKDTLKSAGADIIMSEKYSGTTTARPQGVTMIENLGNYNFKELNEKELSQIEAGNAAGNAFISGLTGAATGVKWGSKLGPCGAVGAYIGGYN